MIIGSFNIRGGDSRIKRKRISSIIAKGQADMLLIQETKLEEVTVIIAMSFWSVDDIGFSFSASEGRSGGILTLWKTNFVSVLVIFRGNGFLGEEFGGRNDVFYIVNVYSPCTLSLKRELWKNLLDLKLKMSDAEWIIGGDFNSVKRRSERVGISSDNNRAERMEFSDFIDGSGLVDVVTPQ